MILDSHIPNLKLILTFLLLSAQSLLLPRLFPSPLYHFSISPLPPISSLPAAETPATTSEATTTTEAATTAGQS